ncbi:caa(3)-type oxidase subunit IV [Blastopirellula marina]|uniref:Caa(3)-type oxidase subunit IV n=1 Tax=Blastopirellula marina TaxID=124 RepID=A0A2S8EZ83_9BACT|nr:MULTISPECIES: cytochrome C oxidase subunit IV family protein [Pirellulaceae]PQO25236.1 caa(3)-type oxidase subunit IV [Blastopirellula marina]RCS41669.1 caa(3)-type oxidase subunit IV [Bremerella cremea]
MSDHSTNHSDDHGHGMGHVMPLSILFGTFVALLFFTGLTVFLADQNLGEIDIWIALTIATIKAGLVATYFMHLRYDKPINVLLFLFTLGFVALFFGITLIDSEQYQPQIQDYYEATTTVTVSEAAPAPPAE